MKIKDLIEKGFYATDSDCQCLKWSATLFLCKCRSPDTGGICGCSEPDRGLRRKQSVMQRWWVWDCSALPAAPLQPRTAGRCLLEGHPAAELPLCSDMFCHC